MRVDIYHHRGDVDFQQEVLRLLNIIVKKENLIMATLDEVIALVTDESTKLDSVIALIDGLKAQLDEALSGVTLPPAVQEKVDAIFAAANTNAAKIVDALDTTPPAPPVEP